LILSPQALCGIQSNFYVKSTFNTADQNKSRQQFNPSELL
jgi:hypothetical protein